MMPDAAANEDTAFTTLLLLGCELYQELHFSAAVRIIAMPNSQWSSGLAVNLV